MEVVGDTSNLRQAGKREGGCTRYSFYYAAMMYSGMKNARAS